jgi:hypothetical protein
MGVFSAIRFDKNFKSFYDRLIANGKHTTQAQIAVMRKIIITAHSLYKNDKRYDMNFGKPKTTRMEQVALFMLHLVSLLRIFNVATDP